MKDLFAKHLAGLQSPATSAFDIVPNDNTELNFATRAIYVGGNGNLHVQFIDNTEVTFQNLVAGLSLPIRLKKVFSTGTTATNLIGLT